MIKGVPVKTNANKRKLNEGVKDCTVFGKKTPGVHHLSHCL